MEPFGVKVSLVEPGNFIIGAPSEVTAENLELNAKVQDTYGEKYLQVSPSTSLRLVHFSILKALIRNDYTIRKESPPQNGTWWTTTRD